MKPVIRYSVTALSSALLLAACGGSGSSSDTEQQAEETNRTIEGTIDGFGSVIIDGVHYDSSSTSFTIDDNPGSESDLRVGQVVILSGSDDGKEGKAMSISYDASVKGPASNVDNAAGTFTVLGQAVVTDSMTVFEGTSMETLSNGDMVEVSGYTDSDGQWRATYVELEDSGEAELRGTVSSLDEAAQTFMIGTQLVSYSGTTEMELDEAALRDGMLVEVEGTVVATDSGDVLEADSIEQEDDSHSEHGDDDSRVSGYITELSDGAMTVGSTPVLLPDDVRYEHGTSADLALNVFVKVEGQFDADGNLVADEVEFEDEVKLELEGPVTAVSDTTVTVMGVEAIVDTSTRVKDERDDLHYFSLSDISVGDYVELRLSENADGTYQALRLEREEDDNEVKVTAPVDSIDTAAELIVMLDITIDMAGVSSPDLSTLVVGDYLEVDGTWNGDIITATEAEYEHDYDDDSHDDSHEEHGNDDSDDDSEDDSDDDSDDDSADDSDDSEDGDD